VSSHKTSGAALATAAALMFAAMTITTQAKEAKVKCEGVNSCKGRSACMSAKNSCKGENACKGQGYLDLTKVQCDAAKAKLREKSGM
jgi:hypothetical protein